MLLQLSSILGELGRGLFDLGLGALQTFTTKEIERNQVSRENDLLRLQAQFGGAPPQPVFNDIRVNPVMRTFLGAPPPQTRLVGTQTTNGTRISVGNGAGCPPRFLRTVDGCSVQHFRFDGTEFVIVESAPQLTGRRWRFDELAKNGRGGFGKFVPVPGRRMNPINPRAMRRAVTRIKRGEVICRDILKILGKPQRRSSTPTTKKGGKK